MVISLVLAFVFAINDLSVIFLAELTVLFVLCALVMGAILIFTEKVKVDEEKLNLGTCEFDLRAIGDVAFYTNDHNYFDITSKHSTVICESFANNAKVTCVKRTYRYPKWVRFVCDFGLLANYSNEIRVTYCISIYDEKSKYLD